MKDISALLLALCFSLVSLNEAKVRTAEEIDAAFFKNGANVPLKSYNLFEENCGLKDKPNNGSGRWTVADATAYSYEDGSLLISSAKKSCIQTIPYFQICKKMTIYLSGSFSEAIADTDAPRLLTFTLINYNRTIPDTVLTFDSDTGTNAEWAVILSEELPVPAPGLYKLRISTNSKYPQLYIRRLVIAGDGKCPVKSQKSSKNSYSKTSKSKTGSDTTGSDTTGSDTTGTDTTGSETTGSDTTGSDTTSKETTGSDTTDSDTTGSDTTGSDTTSKETTGSDTTGKRTTGKDTTGKDTTGSDTTGKRTTGKDTTGKDTTGKDTTGSDTTGSDTTGKRTTGKDTTGSDTTGKRTTGKDTTGKDTTITSTGSKTQKKSSGTSFYYYHHYYYPTYNCCGAAGCPSCSPKNE